MTDVCARLIDYVVFVGSNSPEDENGDTQIPLILNRFPPTDHSDFVLPTDVSLFCQPEGCFTMKPTSELRYNPYVVGKGQAPFAFTITEKESGKVRYGMCLNFPRRIRRILPLTKKHASEDNSEDFGAVRERSIPDNEGSEMDRSIGIYRCAYIHTLTSICLISHHGFFSKLRHLVELLYTLIQKLHERSRLKLKLEETVWGILLGCSKTTKSALVVRSVKEVVIWILRLLSAPAPVPGKTCVYLHVLPRTMESPLLFGLPEISRLPLTDFPLCLPFKVMGAQKTLRILLYMLLEQKIVLQSADYEKLSFCVLALVSLLYPLQYMFPVIPLLPPCMQDAEKILIAPTPYLIGIPSSFYSLRKVFRIPRDVWLIDLDTQEFVYPEVLDEIPDLPEPESNYLIEQLNAIIDSMSETKPTNLAISKYIHNTQYWITKEMAMYNPLEFISDEHSTRVAVRVAMILFFHAKNVLGGLNQHTRTLRLYPRPIVALQFGSFMKSRPTPCLFTSILAKTQSVQYFAETSICAKRMAYQRILEGERSPNLISDHPEWFAPFLTSIHVDVWPSTGDTPLSPGTGPPSTPGPGEPLESSSPAGEITTDSPLSAVLAANPHLGSRKATTGDSEQATSADPPVTPTDEGVSDGETDRSTASLESTNLSDIVSDWLDSGLGDPLRKESTVAGSSLSTTTSLNSSQLRPGSASPVDTQFCFRLGEALPAELAHHFSPPRQPVLTSPVANEAPTSSSGEDKVASLDPDKPLPVFDWLSQETSDLPQKPRDHRSPSSPSISKTLRSLQRISANMFNPEAGAMMRKPISPSIIEDGDSSLQYLDSKTAASVELLKKRKENERYVNQIASMLRAGEVPHIFSRHRIISMMEQESNRNLMLTLLNNNFDLRHVEPESHVRNVVIGEWKQYKAIVWMLQHIIAGIEANFRPDVVIPMAATNWRGDRIPQDSGSDVLRSAQGVAFGGGTASAFGLLEIAHTHYFQLGRKAAERWRRSSESVFGDESGSSNLHTPNARRSVDSSRATLGKWSAAISSLVTKAKVVRMTDPLLVLQKRVAEYSRRFSSVHVDGSGWISSVKVMLHPKTETYSNPSPTNNSAKQFSSSFETREHTGLCVQSSGWEKANLLSSLEQFCASNGTNAIHAGQHAATNAGSDATTELSCNMTDIFKDEVEILPPFKSVRSQGFRYRYSHLIRTEKSSPRQTPVDTSPTSPDILAPQLPTETIVNTSVLAMVERRSKAAAVNRTYVFEDLVNASGKPSALWSNPWFWEDAFLDSVAQERDILGMDYRPSELLQRYTTASALKRKRLELEEDELLATLLHNTVAFMLLMSLPYADIRRIARRLLAKTHLGLHYSQEISNLLDVLENLHANDIDLKPPKSRFTYHFSYEVHAGGDANGSLLFMEVCPSFLLLRDLSGAVVRRWWYDQLINVASHPHSHTIRLMIRFDQRTTLHSFYSKKCQTIYHEIQRAMELMSTEENQRPIDNVADTFPNVDVLNPNPYPTKDIKLTGELNVLNADTQARGTIKISSDGFLMKFDGIQTFVGIPYIKRCGSPSHDLFVIDFFDLKENRLVTCRLHTDVATSMVCMFSRLIASSALAPPTDEKQSAEPAGAKEPSRSGDVPPAATG